MNWFRCETCHYVWADRIGPDAVAAPGPAGARHILVVDDDPRMLHIMAAALPQYRVSIARDGQEALTLMRSHPIDLLITDYLMPVMTGQELVAVCEHEGIRFKVLLVTGNPDALKDAPSWLASHPHLTKPVDFDELRDAVARLID